MTRTSRATRHAADSESFTKPKRFIVPKISVHWNKSADAHYCDFIILWSRKTASQAGMVADTRNHHVGSRNRTVPLACGYDRQCAGCGVEWPATVTPKQALPDFSVDNLCLRNETEESGSAQARVFRSPSRWQFNCLWPRAALTILMPLGALGLAYMVPISTVIIVLLSIVHFSYMQTIGSYSTEGGSCTVSSQNLGVFTGLLVAPALMIDYVLNVAVGIFSRCGSGLRNSGVAAPCGLSMPGSPRDSHLDQSAWHPRGSGGIHDANVSACRLSKSGSCDWADWCYIARATTA